GLPPSPDGPRPRMLDGAGQGEEFASRTLAGHEPAKAATSARMKADSSGARAVETDAAHPAATKRPSSAPTIFGILLVVAGATVAIEGTDMTGPAPFTAKLEKDKDYKAKLSAPGFVAQEIDVKGGQKEITAKLVAKPKQISVTSTPAGADIVIDGVPTQKLTP